MSLTIGGDPRPAGCSGIERRWWAARCWLPTFHVRTTPESAAFACAKK